MLKNECGSNDGIHVSKFHEGCEYNAPQEISFDLANVFLNVMKVAIEVKPEIPKVKPQEKLETKVIEPKENKIEKPKSKTKKKK